MECNMRVLLLCFSLFLLNNQAIAGVFKKDSSTSNIAKSDSFNNNATKTVVDDTVSLTASNITTHPQPHARFGHTSSKTSPEEPDTLNALLTVGLKFYKSHIKPYLKEGTLDLSQYIFKKKDKSNEKLKEAEEGYEPRQVKYNEEVPKPFLRREEPRDSHEEESHEEIDTKPEGRTSKEYPVSHRFKGRISNEDYRTHTYSFPVHPQVPYGNYNPEIHRNDEYDSLNQLHVTDPKYYFHELDKIEAEVRCKSRNNHLVCFKRDDKNKNKFTILQEYCDDEGHHFKNRDDIRCVPFYKIMSSNDEKDYLPTSLYWPNENIDYIHERIPESTRQVNGYTSHHELPNFVHPRNRVFIPGHEATAPNIEYEYLPNSFQYIHGKEYHESNVQPTHEYHPVNKVYYKDSNNHYYNDNNNNEYGYDHDHGHTAQRSYANTGLQYHNQEHGYNSNSNKVHYNPKHDNNYHGPGYDYIEYDYNTNEKHGNRNLDHEYNNQQHHDYDNQKLDYNNGHHDHRSGWDQTKHNKVSNSKYHLQRSQTYSTSNEDSYIDLTSPKTKKALANRIKKQPIIRSKNKNVYNHIRTEKIKDVKIPTQTVALKKPFYYRVSDTSPLSNFQTFYKILKFSNTSLHLVDAHDFNPGFIETVYVKDNETETYPDVNDGEAKRCNPCNKNFNERYPRLNDWHARYLSCHKFIPFENKGKPEARIINENSVQCNSDSRFESICNPCGRKYKIASTAAKNSDAHVQYLTIEEIFNNQEIFYDEDDNIYEFLTSGNPSAEFDKSQGYGVNSELYDTSQINKYLSGDKK